MDSKDMQMAGLARTRRGTVTVWMGTGPAVHHTTARTPVCMLGRPCWQNPSKGFGMSTGQTIYVPLVTLQQHFPESVG